MAIVGFVFKDEFAAAHGEALERFVAAARQAKQELAADASAWPGIMARIGEKDPAAAELYRSRYAAGAARRPVADEEADAKLLFAALAQIGGSELVGSARELDPNVYYKLRWGG